MASLRAAVIWMILWHSMQIVLQIGSWAVMVVSSFHPLVSCWRPKLKGKVSMPGNLIQAAPSTVMPLSLCTAFTELREYAGLQSAYHDGTIHRLQLAQTSRKTWRQTKRLSATLLAALASFYAGLNGGLMPFLYYSPFDVASGQEPGSNYDPTGANTQGRYIVVFRGNWAQSTDVCRTNVSGLVLVEVA